MPMTAKEMSRFLKKHKFRKVKGGGKGGHQKFYNPETKRTTEVPMHGELKKGEEHDILKQAGLI